MNLFYIFLGGGLGAVARYLVNVYTTESLIKYTNIVFPYGTLIANIIGSLLIGIAFGIFRENITSNKSLELFVIVGLLGGFTTFSAFSLEIYNMLNAGEYLTSLIYIFSSLLIAILFTYLGIKISSFF